jgi:hypothetical protein
MRANTNTSRRPPKNATGASTGGSFDRSLMSLNSSAGSRMANRNLDSASPYDAGHRPELPNR